MTDVQPSDFVMALATISQSLDALAGEMRTLLETVAVGAQVPLLTRELSRRVYVPELLAQLGYSKSWFNMHVRDGRIPSPSYDPGGKRGFYTASEAAAIIDQLNAAAHHNRPPMPGAAEVPRRKSRNGRR